MSRGRVLWCVCGALCLLTAGAVAGRTPVRADLPRTSLDVPVTRGSRLRPLSGTDLTPLGSADQLLRADPTVLTPGFYRLTSPNFPGRYPNDYDNTWTLVGDEGQDLTITCFYIIESETTCSNDFLEINGEARCGFGFYSVTSDEIEVNFVTNDSVRRRGFKCAVIVPPATEAPQK